LSPIENDRHIVHSLNCVDILSIDGEMAVDYIGRFENLQHDFNELCQMQLGRTVLLPHLSPTARDHYSTYYTKDTRERVGEIFQKDIERFGYKFETA